MPTSEPATSRQRATASSGRALPPAVWRALQPIPALTALPALLHLGLPLGLALGTWLLAAGPLVIERWYATFRHLRGWDRRRLPRS